MAAIITDQIRILNAKNFVSGVTSSTNAYYSFVGLTNPTDIATDLDIQLLLLPKIVLKKKMIIGIL